MDSTTSYGVVDSTYYRYRTTSFSFGPILYLVEWVFKLEHHSPLEGTFLVAYIMCIHYSYKLCIHKKYLIHSYPLHVQIPMYHIRKQLRNSRKRRR